MGFFKNQVCCHPSRPDKFIVFVQMEKYSQSHWDVWHAFINGWASHVRCKLRVHLHVSCHGLALQHSTHHGTCPLVCLPSSSPPAGSPYLFKYWRGTKPARCQNITWHNVILHMQAHFMLWEQSIGTSLKAMRTLVIRPFQGYGNTASLSYPGTWVRKPDCLHLPYTR